MSTRKKRMPKDLREVVEAYLRLGSRSYATFIALCFNAGEDVPWFLDESGYAVPRSITEIGKPIELSAQERAEEERARKERENQERRNRQEAKRMRREQRALAGVMPQGSA